jgi:membrane-associated phospholipid phosphatase
MNQFEQLYSLMKKPWIIALYALLVILVFNFADKPTALYFYHLDLRSNVHILHLFTALGKWSIYVLVFFFLGLFFRYVRKNPILEQKAWFLFACIVLTNLVGFVLKIVLSRSRPDLLFDGNLFGFYWFKFNDLYWSFPSGHSITIAGLAAGLGVLFPRYLYFFIALALLVISTRIFLYFHYLSDVMTGFYLSILVVGAFTESLKKHNCLAIAIDESVR